MVMQAHELAGLSAAYWEEHALDMRVRLSAAPYLDGSWGYHRSAPKVLYPLPLGMRAAKLTWTTGARKTNCSTLTISILAALFPSVDWEAADYGDCQVYADRLPDRPAAPIECVVRQGIGTQVTVLVAGRWHLVQGWRRFDPTNAKPALRYAGHAFLVLADDDGGIDQILEATEIGGIGPRYKTATMDELKASYPKGLHFAVLHESQRQAA